LNKSLPTPALGNGVNAGSTDTLTALSFDVVAVLVVLETLGVTEAEASVLAEEDGRKDVATVVIGVLVVIVNVG